MSHLLSLSPALLLRLAAAAGLGLPPAAPADEAPASAPASLAEQTALAREAFVWGYPLVVSARTMAGGAVNTLSFQGGLSDEGSREIVRPNNDTLYAKAVLDLRAGPMVLAIPAPRDGRYFSWQFLDPWTETLAYVGTRATDGEGGVFVVTPPGWQGTLPADVQPIASPTTQLVVLGRYAVRDDRDALALLAFQDDLVLEPLSTFTGAAATPVDPLPPAPGSPRATGSDPMEFWDELGDALVLNGPRTDAEQALLDGFAALGIGPGLHPSESAAGDLLQALIAGATEGLADVRAGGAVEERNGWRVPAATGAYGDDYLSRARIAYSGWGANVAEEAFYATLTTDVDGAPLDGAVEHHLVFPTDGLPATAAFWSVTVYGPDGFLVGNELGRYSIGSRTEGLSFGADGSLDVVLSAARPADDANWLPVPDGSYNLTLRVYLPSEEVLDGTWAPPPAVAAD